MKPADTYPRPELDDFDKVWTDLENFRHRSQSGQLANPTKPFPDHLRFSEAGNAREYQLFGWDHPEKSFTWTNGREAFLELPALTQAVAHFLNVRIKPFTSPQIPVQRVKVSLGNVCVARWEVAVEDHYFAYFPAYLLTTPQTLIFHFTDAASPRDMALSEDERDLGVQFFDLWLTPWTNVTF